MNIKDVGELQFNVGFKRMESITLFEENVEIVLKLKAYFEEDGVTNEQISSYVKFNHNKDENCKKIEKALLSYDSNAKERFQAKTLLFGRNGECALLCDDSEEPDEGIALILYPSLEILSQDDYL